MLFWIFWVIDLLLLVICLYETFAVSSNSSLAVPATILAVLLAASLWARTAKPSLAIWLAGAPAGLALLFVVFFVLFSMGNKNWK